MCYKNTLEIEIFKGEDFLSDDEIEFIYNKLTINLMPDRKYKIFVNRELLKDLETILTEELEIKLEKTKN